jgi:dTMP kinase
MRGHVLAFEGLDQSGKQTQSERLAEVLRGEGRRVEFLSFPEYPTAIGAEIGRALEGERDYAADTPNCSTLPTATSSARACSMAGRRRRHLRPLPRIERSIRRGPGLDPAWLLDVQRHLPQLTSPSG